MPDYENSTGPSSSLHSSGPSLYHGTSRRASMGCSVVPVTPCPTNRGMFDKNSTLANNQGVEQGTTTSSKRASFKRCNTIGPSVATGDADLADSVSDLVMLAPMIDFAKLSTKAAASKATDTPNATSPSSSSPNQDSQSSEGEDKSPTAGGPNEELDNFQTPTASTEASSDDKHELDNRLKAHLSKGLTGKETHNLMGFRERITKSHSFCRLSSPVHVYSLDVRGKPNTSGSMDDLSMIDESNRSVDSRKSSKGLRRCRSLQTNLNDDSSLNLNATITDLTKLQIGQAGTHSRRLQRGMVRNKSRDDFDPTTIRNIKGGKKNTIRGNVGKGGSIDAGSGHSNATKSSLGSRNSTGTLGSRKNNSCHKLEEEDDMDSSYQRRKKNSSRSTITKSSLKTALDAGSGHSDTMETMNNPNTGGGGRRKNRGTSPKKNLKETNSNNGKLTKGNLKLLGSNSDHQPTSNKKAFQRTLSRSSSDGDMSLSASFAMDGSIQGGATRSRFLDEGNGSFNGSFSKLRRHSSKTTPKRNGSDKMKRHTITSLTAPEGVNLRRAGSSTRLASLSTHHYLDGEEKNNNSSSSKRTKSKSPSRQISKDQSLKDSSISASESTSRRSNSSSRKSTTTPNDSNHSKNATKNNNNNKEKSGRSSSRSCSRRLSSFSNSKSKDSATSGQSETDYKKVVEAALMTVSDSSSKDNNEYSNDPLYQLLSAIVTATRQHNNLAAGGTTCWSCECGHTLEVCCKFCGMCGARQHWVCSDCGFDRNKSKFRFCGGCGIPKYQAQQEQLNYSSTTSDRIPRSNRKIIDTKPVSLLSDLSIDDRSDDESTAAATITTKDFEDDHDNLVNEPRKAKFHRCRTR